MGSGDESPAGCGVEPHGFKLYNNISILVFMPMRRSVLVDVTRISASNSTTGEKEVADGFILLIMPVYPAVLVASEEMVTSMPSSIRAMSYSRKRVMIRRLSVSSTMNIRPMPTAPSRAITLVIVPFMGDAIMASSKSRSCC